MHSRGLILAGLATLAVAAPTSNNFDDVYNFNPDLEEFYARVSNHIGNIGRGVQVTDCDLSNVTLPASSLPASSGTLKHVAIGRGTQNYTCADSTADTVPVQIGALANLYDASCLAANFPDLMNLVTDIVLNYSIPPSDTTTPLAPANLELLGHHYFMNITLPTFNLNTTPQKQDGILLTSKKNATHAPDGAVIGQFNAGYGACPWLYLTTIEGTTDGYTEVYRVNTAGGNAPASCAGQPAAFQIQYAAQYFFFV